MRQIHSKLIFSIHLGPSQKTSQKLKFSLQTYQPQQKDLQNLVPTWLREGQLTEGQSCQELLGKTFTLAQPPNLTFMLGSLLQLSMVEFRQICYLAKETMDGKDLVDLCSNGILSSNLVSHMSQMT